MIGSNRQSLCSDNKSRFTLSLKTTFCRRKVTTYFLIHLFIHLVSGFERKDKARFNQSQADISVFQFPVNKWQQWRLHQRKQIEGKWKDDGQANCIFSHTIIQSCNWLISLFITSDFSKKMHGFENQSDENEPRFELIRNLEEFMW